MNSKGQGWAVDTMPFYVIFVMIVGILILVFSFLMQKYISDQFKIPEGLEDDIVSQRFFSPYCFGAEDMSTAIDLSLFTQQRLNDCYAIDKNSKFLAYKLSLLISDKTVVVQTLNWEDKTFERLRVKDVDVVNDGIVKKGTMTVEVQHVG